LLYTSPLLTCLPLLHKQHMHCQVRQYNERTPVDPQTNTIPPQRLHIEAEARQDSRARDFDIKPVLVVDEREVFDLVNNEAFKGVVEYR
jgi:hypothetical protein